MTALGSTDGSFRSTASTYDSEVMISTVLLSAETVWVGCANGIPEASKAVIETISGGLGTAPGSLSLSQEIAKSRVSGNNRYKKLCFINVVSFKGYTCVVILFKVKHSFLPIPSQEPR